ncbi:PAS domain S-box protein [uncultured Paludibaculum sp.]|uniref:PAS domain S-box protein n=1 Tax=uncultured Paludibaculum sp. TaxID=1765020 RepID=UPI002AABD166|nr:PAS domain S-box protein [uncultured Paludibaculum sp.]
MNGSGLCENRHLVLVVDDDQQIVDLLHDRLSRDGYDLLTAASAAEALQITALRVPSVVLLDVVMPGPSGLELCRLLKQDPRTADVPVIILTGMIKEEDVEAGSQAGAADYIKKPFDLDELRFRVRAQIRLREAIRKQTRAQHRLSLISRAAKDAIILLDETGCVVHWNEAATSMFGYSHEEILGRNMHETIAPERFRGAYRAAFSRFQESGEGTAVGVTLELRALRKSGEEFPIELSLTATQMDGQWWSLGIVRDISDRLEAGSSLRNSEERFRRLFEEGPLGIALITLEFTIYRANAALTRMLGYSEAELLNRSVADLTWPEDLPATLKQADLLLSGELPSYRIRKRYVTKNGAIVWADAAVTLIRDEHGAPLYGLVMIEDITARVENERNQKLAEARLRESENRLTKILENVPVGIAIVGLEKRIRWANQAALRMIGAPGLEIIVGQPCNQVLCQSVNASCPFCDSGGAVLSAETTMARSDGALIPVLKSTHTVEFDNEVVRLETFMDLRDRKRLETELGHSRKLEAVGQLAAGVAHEINTPIQYVGDSVQFLKEAFESFQQVLPKYRACAASAPEDLAGEIARLEDEMDIDWLLKEMPASFARCQDGVERVARIVRAMKEFAHPDQREKAPADLNHAIQSTLTIAHNEYKYIADIETNFGDIPQVVCHVSELNQVFLNLIVNAAHAIQSSLEGTGLRGAIGITTSQRGQNVQIDIEDTGGGIPDEIKDRIFDPFFTTKAVGKGTGQGLAIAHSVVVDKHGGSLTFTTKYGLGTTFTVLLPIDGKAGEKARRMDGQEDSPVRR